MRKQITLALTVVIAVLLGGGLSQNHVWAEQTATDPSPTVTPSSPQTDVVCGAPPTPCPISRIFHGKDNVIQDHELDGVGWLCSDTEESPTQYCVEEGGSIRFPDGHLVKGPAKGTYKKK